MRYIFFVGMVLFMLSAFRQFDSFKIYGKITDPSGNPIAGVTVTVKGSSKSTTTNAAGSFTLKVTKQRVTLVISAIGFETREVTVTNDGKPVNITLGLLSTALHEVIVTAPNASSYGYTNPSNTLIGKVSGVQVGGSRSSRRNTGPDHYGWHDPYYGRRKDKLDKEGYDNITENRFLEAKENPLSTFSIDVDAASYSNVRRFLQTGKLPPAGAVRIEEMINYFQYDYPQPTGDAPFSINTEIASCPWNTDHKLVMIGLQGKRIPVDNLPPSNLVFLIDVSGSMQDENKLPLVQSSMKLLVEQLRPQDKVAIVVYAGQAGLVLPSTSGEEKTRIKDAIESLQAGGSTAGGEGIKLAYQVAKENFIAEGNNRVILCTDGDFNVGVSSNDELERLIEEKRKSGVFLTVLGYGTGNYQDSKMQRLADKGNGNHAYIDNYNEARKVLVSEFGGTLFTIAKDVKLQIEFNPAKVQAYRLIGYENRLLNKEDFNNDEKDAGELGSGHTVTALYEVIPAGVKSKFIEDVDPLKYQQKLQVTGSGTSEIMTVKFRYKKPDGDRSRLLEQAIIDKDADIKNASANFRFAAAVASFGMLLRESEFRQKASYEQAWQLAKDALGNDTEGYRSEFLKLLRNAQSLAAGVKKESDVTIRE